jgi:hypothetical protein
VQWPIGSFFDRGVLDLLSLRAERDHAGVKLGSYRRNRSDGYDRSHEDAPEPVHEPTASWKRCARVVIRDEQWRIANAF